MSTVLVTRSREDAPTWVAGLEARGHRALTLACIERRALDSATIAAALDDQLPGAAWLVVSSAAGAGVLGRHRRLIPDGVRIAAVGDTTARACRKHLGRVDLVGSRDGRALGAALRSHLDADSRAAPARIVHAGAARPSTSLSESLAGCDVELVLLPLYATLPAAVREPKLDLESQGVDIVLLASPSAAEGLIAQVRVPIPAAIVTLGPATTRRARALGLDVSAEARSPTLAALLEVMA